MSSGIVEELRARARAVGAKLVFPEGDDPRVVEAAATLANTGIARPILIGRAAAVQSAARAARVALPEAVRLIDPDDENLRARLSQVLRQLPAFAALSENEAVERLGDPILLSALLVRCGEADGCVGGAIRPTRDVLQIAAHHRSRGGRARRQQRVSDGAGGRTPANLR